MHPAGRSHLAHQPAECVGTESRGGRRRDARVEAAGDARRRVRRRRLGRAGQRRLLAQTRQTERLVVQFRHYASRFANLFILSY